jgi:hypothetical protein
VFLGIRIGHVLRKLEAVAGVFTALALLTPGGRAVAKTAAKSAAAAARVANLSWRERRRLKREEKAAVERDRIMREMYEQNADLRSAVDRASSKRWWS